MSGYDSDTGIFSLTESKTLKYLGINKSIDKPIQEDWCTYCIKLFQNKGYTVIKETKYGIDVVADAAQIWEVLSGEKINLGIC